MEYSAASEDQSLRLIKIRTMPAIIRLDLIPSETKNGREGTVLRRSALHPAGRRKSPRTFDYGTSSKCQLTFGHLAIVCSCSRHPLSPYLLIFYYYLFIHCRSVDSFCFYKIILVSPWMWRIVIFVLNNWSYSHSNNWKQMIKKAWPLQIICKGAMPRGRYYLNGYIFHLYYAVALNHITMEFRGNRLWFVRSQRSRCLP